MITANSEVLGVLGGIIGAIAVTIFLALCRRILIGRGLANAQDLCAISSTWRVVGHVFQEDRVVVLTLMPLRGEQKHLIQDISFSWKHPSLWELKRADNDTFIEFFPKVPPRGSSLLKWTNYLSVVRFAQDAFDDRL